jgi:hypothetical protein
VLVQTDKNELGDVRLSPEEAVYREREELLKLASTRKIGGQAELEDAERSAGPRISWQEVIRRLRLCNPKLHFADSQGGAHIAVYRLKNRAEAADHEYDPEKFDWWNDHIYVTGFPKQDMAEYSHVVLDSSNLPVREIRGWRSVLIALIKASAISHESTLKHFGEAIGARSGRWHEQLQHFRNNRSIS